MNELGTDHIAALTDQMYQAVYDDSRWGELMSGLKAHFKGSNGAFGFVDAKTGNTHMLHADCDPEYATMCYRPELANPLAPRLFSGPQGDIITDQSVMPRDEFRRTTFFNEWLRPQGEHTALNMKALVQGEVSAHLMVLRGDGQRPFDEHDVSVARQVLPTLMRVAHLRVRVGALRLVSEADAYDALNIGFIVVDGDGHILLSNCASERFLSGPQYGLDATKGQLSAQSKPEQLKLQSIIALACTDFDGVMGRGGDMVVSDPITGLPTASLTAAPMRDASAFGLPVGRAVVVFVQDLASRLPPRFEERARSMFGLTRKEATLAAILASGQTLKEAADQRFISMPTARTQLAQIFRKTHTSQQSQLVSLLLGILPVGR